MGRKVVVLQGREPGHGIIHLVPSGPTYALGQADRCGGSLKAPI